MESNFKKFDINEYQKNVNKKMKRNISNHSKKPGDDDPKKAIQSQARSWQSQRCFCRRVRLFNR